MICSSCGSKIEEGVVFCSQCGSRVKKSESGPPGHATRVISSPPESPTRQMGVSKVMSPTREITIPADISKTREVRIDNIPSSTREMRADKADTPKSPAGHDVVGRKTQIYSFGVDIPDEKIMQIVVKEDQKLGEIPHLIGAKAVIGRDEGEIITNDSFMSGRHAEIVQKDGRFFLRDLNSSNGVFIRITDDVEIVEGTEFLMGKLQFRVKKVESKGEKK
ncbi:MAG: hypothetical protein B6244_14265 [Candidatus Cloacimonetes bacterium 4572_55]|nr:MAG: hypothetical protein B6244_14265 [Candidatus Cloacimonetes bacterium 4572_55]